MKASHGPAARQLVSHATDRDTTDDHPLTPEESLRSNKTFTSIIHGLYAEGFLVGITSIAAIILNYVKRADVAGTFLE